MEEKLLDSINNNELNAAFKTVATREEAKYLVDFLDQHQIYCRVSTGGTLDRALEGDTFSHQFELFVAECDLERAKTLCLEDAKQALDSIPSDYFLYQYSNEELIDILVMRDEWSELDVLLTEQLLQQRGVTVNLEQLRAKQSQHLEKIAQPEEIKAVWIVLAYVFVLLSGFYGSFIGYCIWKVNKKLPDGERIAAYTEKTRQHGFRIFLIGLVLLVLNMALRLIRDETSFEIFIPFYL